GHPCCAGSRQSLEQVRLELDLLPYDDDGLVGFQSLGSQVVSKYEARGTVGVERRAIGFVKTAEVFSAQLAPLVDSYHSRRDNDRHAIRGLERGEPRAIVEQQSIDGSQDRRDTWTGGPRI